MKMCGFYRGKVLDNDDSSEDHPYYGAIKVLVPEIYGTEVEKDKLPWARAMIPYGYGKDDEGFISTSLFVPKINTWVWVTFEDGNAQRPVYFGGWIGGEETELPEEFKEDGDRSGAKYPDIKGWMFQFDGGCFCLRIVDDRRLEIFFDKDNIIEIDSKGDPPNDGKKQICVRSQWLVRLKSDLEIKLEAPKITIEAESELNIESKGPAEVKAAGVLELAGATLHGTGDVFGTLRHPV